MARSTDQYDEDELDAPENLEEVDYLDDFGDDDLENLSSDLDRWPDDDDGGFNADRDYLYGLLR